MLLALLLFFITLALIIYHIAEEIQEKYKKIYVLNKPIYVKVYTEKINDNYDSLPDGFRCILKHNLSSVYIIRKPGNVIVFKNSITDSKEVVLISKESDERRFWHLYLAGYFKPNP